MTPAWLPPLAWTVWTILTALAIVAYAGTQPEPGAKPSPPLLLFRTYGAVAAGGLLLVGLAKALRWLW